MKRTLLPLIAFIFLSACAETKPTRDEIVKNNAEEHLKPNLNDPESYEFASLKLVDSVLYSDNIDYRRADFEIAVKYDKQSLERYEGYKTTLPSMYDEEEISELKSKISRNEKILTSIDSLEAALGEDKNKVASYTYSFTFRGNNALGAKIVNTYILQTNPAPGYEVLNMTNDEDKVILNPNDFPGYREMIAKYN